jgi:hypothetical protein
MLTFLAITLAAGLVLAFCVASAIESAAVLCSIKRRK